MLIADSLSNFNVLVASDVIDPTQSSDMQLCAHVDGPFAAGAWIEEDCNPALYAR